MVKWIRSVSEQHTSLCGGVHVLVWWSSASLCSAARCARCKLERASQAAVWCGPCICNTVSGCGPCTCSGKAARAAALCCCSGPGRSTSTAVLLPQATTVAAASSSSPHSPSLPAWYGHWVNKKARGLQLQQTRAYACSSCLLPFGACHQMSHLPFLTPLIKCRCPSFHSLINLIMQPFAQSY